MIVTVATPTRPFLRLVFVLLAASLWLLVGRTAEAHANGVSYLRIETGRSGSTILASWDIAAADLQLPLELDANGDGRIGAAEIDARRAAILQFAGNRLAIRRGDGPCRLAMQGISTRQRDAQLYVALRLDGDCPRNGPLTVTSNLFFGSRGYATLLDVQTANARFPAALSMGDARWMEPAAPSVAVTLLRFLREGIWHVLIGYDHIAFLLLLLLPSVLRGTDSGWTAAENGREVFRDLLKIVTAFTIAHSITLGLASTGAVRMPVQPIEVAIAGSIVVAGLLNLFPAATGWRLRLAFGFGFVHGFGFANALREIVADGLRLAPMLAGFNLGVEIAQLMIVVAALPVLWFLSRGPRYSRRLMPALSLATAMTGAIWLVERL